MFLYICFLEQCFILLAIFYQLRKEKDMSKSAVIELLCAIVAFGFFLISWLVFKNVTRTDWIILIVGCLELVAFYLELKKDKK